jgi:two-component system phosphate regulon response regulator PhoB
MAPNRAVLLVDDSLDTLEMYAMGLAFAGYRPLTAHDHASALGQLKNERPAAVVTDLQLVGGGGGWELIEEIKKDPSTRQIPVVVLTGRTDPSIAMNALRVGCVAVLTKPCLPEELASVLQRVLPVSA